MARALAAGRDRKGLFQNASYWLRNRAGSSGDSLGQTVAYASGSERTVADASGSERTVAYASGSERTVADASGSESDCTVWEPCAGQVEEPDFTAIRTADVRTCSYAFGLLTLVLVLWLRLKLSAVNFFRACASAAQRAAWALSGCRSLAKCWPGFPWSLRWRSACWSMRCACSAAGHAPFARHHRRRYACPAPAAWRLRADPAARRLFGKRSGRQQPGEKTAASAAGADDVRTVFFVERREPDGTDRTTAYVAPELVQRLRTSPGPPWRPRPKPCWCAANIRGRPAVTYLISGPSSTLTASQRNPDWCCRSPVLTCSKDALSTAPRRIQSP